MGGRQRWQAVVATLVGAIALQLGGPVVAYAADTPGQTLWQRAFAADVVVRARIVHPRWEIPIGDPPTPYPVVEAHVLEILKGDVAPGRLTLARTGQESPPYTVGQETVLFLQSIAKSKTLGSTTVATVIEWASLPPPIENVQLTPASRSAYLAAIRNYAAIASMPQSAERGAHLRALTMDLVTSAEPAVARSALRDLALAGNAPLLTRTEATRLGKLIFDPTVSIETRLTLLHETERRGLIFGPTAWARLLRETRGAELHAVLRTIGTGHRSTATNIELEKMLKGTDRALAIAAARALGSVGNREAVRPLLRLLAQSDTDLQRAIIQSLGNIRTQNAREALDLVAETHPDPATRQAALTAVIVLARRHGTTLAPMIEPSGEQSSRTRPPPVSTARASQPRPERAAERRHR